MKLFFFSVQAFIFNFFDYFFFFGVDFFFLFVFALMWIVCEHLSIDFAMHDDHPEVLPLHWRGQTSYPMSVYSDDYDNGVFWDMDLFSENDSDGPMQDSTDFYPELDFDLEIHHEEIVPELMPLGRFFGYEEAFGESYDYLFTDPKHSFEAVCLDQENYIFRGHYFQQIKNFIYKRTILKRFFVKLLSLKKEPNYVTVSKFLANLPFLKKEVFFSFLHPRSSIFLKKKAVVDGCLDYQTNVFFLKNPGFFVYTQHNKDSFTFFKGSSFCAANYWSESVFQWWSSTMEEHSTLNRNNIYFLGDSLWMDELDYVEAESEYDAYFNGFYDFPKNYKNYYKHYFQKYGLNHFLLASKQTASGFNVYDTFSFFFFRSGHYARFFFSLESKFYLKKNFFLKKI